MININWDLAPDGATEIRSNGNIMRFFNEHNHLWNGAAKEWVIIPNEYDWKTIATRPQTPRKTVADAYEYFDGVWKEPDTSVCCYADFGDEGFKFVLWIRDWIWSNGECYEVCTREEFEAYAKKQEGEKWTHRTNAGELCKIHVEEPDVNGVIIVLNDRGEYLRHNSDSLKEIKTQISKAEAWDMLNKKASTVNEFGNALIELQDKYEIID